MMPPAGERSVKWRKYTGEEYVIWMSSQTGLPILHELMNAPKNTIDFTYEMHLKDKPSWVEAAEEALESSVDEPETVAEAIAEEEGVEEIEEEESEEVLDEASEEIEVPLNDNPFPAQDYDSMTVKELQEVCRERGLTIRGTKAEVVMRLRRDDEGIVEQETEDDAEAPSEEAAEEELDAPSEESEAVTEEVTDNDNSGETSNTDEEE